VTRKRASKSFNPRITRIGTDEIVHRINVFIVFFKPVDSTGYISENTCVSEVERGSPGFE
jgi:hypothetical protein